MMYLEPDLVRTELMPTEVKAQALPYSVYPARHDLVPDCGVLASPVGSTKEKGKLIVDKAIEGFIKIFKKEFN